MEENTIRKEMKIEWEQAHTNIEEMGTDLISVCAHASVPHSLCRVPANLPLCLLLSVATMCTVEFLPIRM